MKPARLSAACALLYALPTLRNGFVLDDKYLLAPARPLWQLLTTPWGGGAGGEAYARVNAAYYRPLTEALYLLEHALFGAQAWGWHLVSALLHALAAALCARLIARVTGREAAALAGGLLFAVLPVHTEAIAAASYQTTLLATVLALAALLSLERAWLASLLGGLAILAKEEAVVTLPFAAIWWALDRRALGERPLRALGGLLAATACVLLLRASVVAPSAVTYFAGQPRATVVWTMLGVPALYLELLLLPLRLCPFYDWFVVPFSDGPNAAALRGLGALAALALAFALALRRRRAAAIGLLWLAAGLVPVMHFVPILNVAAERFLYLPSVGWSLALAASLPERPPRWLAVAGCALLLAYVARSEVRFADFRDDRALNEATARDFPETPTPLLNLAEWHRAHGDRAAARRALEEAQRRAPGWDVPARRLAERAAT